MKNELTLRERLSVCHIFDPESFIGSMATFKSMTSEQIQIELLKTLKIHSRLEEIEKFIVKQDSPFIGHNIKPYKFIQRDSLDSKWACPRCLKLKDPLWFKLGMGICYHCKHEIDAIYREKNKDNIKEYHKSPKFVYSQLMSQAKRRGMPFELDFVYYLDNIAYKTCFYCGSNDTKHWADRVINDHSIGYTEENTVPCCEKCNKMKMARTKEDFIEHCKKVAAFNTPLTIQ